MAPPRSSPIGPRTTAIVAVFVSAAAIALEIVYTVAHFVITTVHRLP